MDYQFNYQLFNQPSLAIIIDCYDDSHGADYIDVLTNIKFFCEDNPNVVAVALATYVDHNLCVINEQPWGFQGADFFCNFTKWDTLSRLWEDAKDNPLNKLNVKTHPILLNMKKRNDQVFFAAWSDLQILYYCNYINPSIENIFVFGKHWNVCLKVRPLGWVSLHNLNHHNLFSKQMNIISHKKCVIGIDHDATESTNFEIIFPWHEIDNDYLLLSNFDVNQSNSL